MTRPDVVLFDVIETLFPLEPVARRLDAVGIGAERLDAIFGAVLRDAFALDATGVYRPFPEVAGSVVTAALPPGHPEDAVETVLSGFSELTPHADVAAAMDRLAGAGIRLAALTNGSRDVTRGNLERAGLADRLERIMVIDDVGRWKPRAEVYHHAAGEMGVAPGAAMLVAAHGWDCHGALRAGLRAGYVARGGPYPNAMDAPEIEAADLSALTDALLA